MVDDNKSIFESSFARIEFNVIHGYHLKWVLRGDRFKWSFLFDIRLLVHDASAFLLDEVFDVIEHSWPIESLLSQVTHFLDTHMSHFLMEFRLRPLAGAGEDWVSLVIPYNAAASTQSYLLRGLTPGMDICQYQP